MARILPRPGMVASLFSGHAEPSGWAAPQELPDFSSYPMDAKFGYDTETTSKDPMVARVVGISVCTPDYKKYYLPVGHRGGGNLDENSVKRWAKGNLAGRHLSALNAKYDVHVSHSWGLDLESLDCKMYDPAFSAALLDENRRRFNLNALSQDILGESKEDLQDKDGIADMSASEVGSYAEHDAYLHLKLLEVQQIDIEAQDLTRVWSLENQLIYSTCAMERIGARIDRPKLERWIKEVDSGHEAAILELHRTTGLKVNPNSSKDLGKLFHHLGIPIPCREEELGGGETFEEEYLSKVNHPCVRLVMAARKLHSLNTKYLKKYLKNLDHNNILRYGLHQLRSDDFGTVTGRYASAAPSGGGCNIQQVIKCEGQLEDEFIANWVIRELFIPDDGKVYVSADASQIEFRWFASYSRSDRLIKEYNENPQVDFHQLVADMFGQKRSIAKHQNFGKVYSLGVPKLARKLGYGCKCGCDGKEQWRKASHSPECPIHRAFEINKEYDTRFPEAKKLSNDAMKVAKERGYVRTIMGRRRRYPKGERLHSALNAVIQGTAADTLKVKLLDTYNNRKTLGLTLRATVHDELDGDLESPNKKHQFKELLDSPDSRIPCRVNLLWDVEIGANWRECTE